MGTPFAFVNGEPDVDIGLSDRGFNYGHGLFETVRIAGGSAPLWPWHWRRLRDDAVCLGINVCEELLAAHLKQALAAFPDDGVLKLTVTAGSGGAGYRRDGDENGPHSNYCFQFRELPPERSALLLQPCAYRLPSNPFLAGIKHLNRLDQVMAARELLAAREGLLLDTEGAVVEALSSNLFCLLDGQWMTPDLSLCGVRGVMREYLCAEVFPALGLSVEEGRFGLAELARAKAVFICNAVRGIEPVSAIIGGGEWTEAAALGDIRAQLASQMPCFAS